MRVLRTMAIGLIGIIVLLGLTTAVIGRDQLLTLIFGPLDSVPIDFRTLQRHSRPNQYLMCPVNLCTAETDDISPIYKVPQSQLKAAWLAVVAQQPRVEHLKELADSQQNDFIQRSRLVRYPDLITVRFIPLGEAQSTLAIYSRSQIGHSDLGVNQQRITAWLDQLSSTIPLAR